MEFKVGDSIIYESDSGEKWNGTIRHIFDEGKYIIKVNCRDIPFGCTINKIHHSKEHYRNLKIDGLLEDVI